MFFSLASQLELKKLNRKLPEDICFLKNASPDSVLDSLEVGDTLFVSSVKEIATTHRQVIRLTRLAVEKRFCIFFVNLNLNIFGNKKFKCEPSGELANFVHLLALQADELDSNASILTGRDNEIVSLFEEGLDKNQIAKELGVSIITLNRYIYLKEDIFGHFEKFKQISQSAALLDEHLDEIVQMLDDGETKKSICEQFNCTMSALFYFLKKNKVDYVVNDVSVGVRLQEGKEDIKTMLQKGLPQADIVRKFNTNKRVVSTFIKNDPELRAVYEKHATTRRNRLAGHEQTIWQMREQKIPIDVICKTFGVGPTAIRRAINKVQSGEVSLSKRPRPVSLELDKHVDFIRDLWQDKRKSMKEICLLCVCSEDELKKFMKKHKI